MTKLAVILGVSAGIAGLLGLAGSLVTGAPVGMFISPWTAFDFQWPVLVGYAIFAISFGAAAGGIIRRSVPAMAVTLVAFLAVRIAVYGLIRPHYLPPLEVDQSHRIGAGSGDWYLGQRSVDLSGHPVSDQLYQQLMASAGSLPGSLGDYMQAHGVVVLSIYQPENRFWLFQGMEAGMFIVLAAAAILLLAWSIRRA
jgi:hypothetical protein